MYKNSDSPKSDRQGEASKSAGSEKAVTPALHRCSYCGTKFERASSPCMPFCSVRCHRIDLGHWLNESYGLPWDGEGDRKIDEEDEY